MPSSSKALMDATKKRAEKLQARRKTVDFKELLRMEAEGGDVWLALDESRPLACFAGVWTNWTSVRK